MKKDLKIGKNLVYNLEFFADKYKLPLAVVLTIVILTLPFWGFSTYIMRVIIMIGIYTMLGLGLNILTGYTGYVSLGHAGFYAIGAYTSSLICINFGMSFFIGALIGALFTALCSFFVGKATLHLRGPYFSIVTLGFGEIVKVILLNWDSVTNGTMGVKAIPHPSVFGYELTLSNNGMYYLMVVLVLFCVALCTLVVNSKYGRAFKAIKENELAADMMGIYTTNYKLIAFIVSAFMTGLAGAFYASMISFIDPNSFTTDISNLILSIVILGGMGTTRGMFLGAAVLIALPEVSRFLLDYRFVVYGLVLIVMMRFRPQGLLGWKSPMPYKFPKLAQQIMKKNI